jgi:nucleotide-binding universal stress UspA family protein
MSTVTMPATSVAGPAVRDPDRPDQEPVFVRGTHPPTGGPVLVAVDDDDNAGAVLRYGHGLAARLGVSLRVAYVWSDCRPPDCAHHRHCHRQLAEADQLLSALIAEHLATAEAEQVERDVLHDADPADALVALSASASILVVGSASSGPVVLGATTRTVLGRTRCPVVVVPHRHLSATRATW